MPFFCGTPPYTLVSTGICESIYLSKEELIKRIDFIIGIRKYSGPASYPRDLGYFFSILPDFIILLALLI